MLAPLRRCVDGWPCMVGDLRGRKMRTGSKIENLSTTRHGESRELQLLLFNFLCNVNRAPYRWCANFPTHVNRPHRPPRTATGAWGGVGYLKGLALKERLSMPWHTGALRAAKWTPWLIGRLRPPSEHQVP